MRHFLQKVFCKTIISSGFEKEFTCLTVYTFHLISEKE